MCIFHCYGITRLQKIDVSSASIRRKMRFAWLLCVTFAAFITARKGTDTCVKTFTPNPVGFWPMNSQSVTRDASESRNDGLGHNLVLAEGPSGDKDTALAFSGNINSYMDIPASSILDVGAGGSFSYTGFIKLDRTGGYIWAWLGPTPQSAITISNQRLLVILQSLDIGVGFTDPKLPQVELNRWSFIGVSYDYTNLLLRIKINEDDHVVPMPRLRARTDGSQIYVGKQPHTVVSDANSFRGSMSCLMLFDVALDASAMERVRAYCLVYNAEVRSKKPCSKMGEHGKVSPHHSISVYHKKHSEGDVSYLVSGAIHSNGPRCLVFRYHILGPGEAFSVYLKIEGESKVLVWSRSGMTSGSKTGSVQVNITGQYKIIFEGIHFSTDSDIAVDHTYLGDGPCPEVNYLSHVGGHHLRSHHEAWLFSSMIHSHGPQCLLFYYKLLGGGSRTTLNVHIMRDHNLEPTSIWSSANEPPSWDVGLVRINATGDYKVAFQGVRESTKPSDIAIGSPMIGDGPCPTGGVHQLPQPHEHFPAESRLISSELSSNGPKCLMFFYKISGQKMRTLMVYLSKNHVHLPPIWSRTAQTTGQWILGLVQINTTGEYKVVIEGIRGHSDHESNIAVENIMIHNGPCHRDIEKAFYRENVKTTTAVPIKFPTTPRPNTQAQPAVTTASASTQRPTTTTQLPTTTTEPPVTTIELPTRKTQPPITTTQPPKTATALPTTTTYAPPTTQLHTTTQLPTTTTQPSTTAKQPSTNTTQPPITTAQSSTTTTQPPTTKRPTTTRQPPTTMTHPSTTKPQSPAIMKQPSTTAKHTSTTTTQPPTTKLPTTTRQPPKTTTHPSTTTTQSPATMKQPSTTAKHTSTTTTQPPTTKLPKTTRQPPTATTHPSTTTTQSPATMKQPSTTAKQTSTTTTQPPTNTTHPSTTTTQSPATMKQPSTTEKHTSTTTTQPTTTTKQPPTTTTLPPTTTTQPPTTKQLLTTTIKPLTTTSQPPTTTTHSPTTMTQPPKTTTQPPTTATQSPTTTTQPLTTTTQPPKTTTHTPTTTTQSPATMKQPSTTAKHTSTTTTQPPTTKLPTTTRQPPTTTTHPSTTTTQSPATMKQPSTTAKHTSTTTTQPPTKTTHSSTTTTQSPATMKQPITTAKHTSTTTTQPPTTKLPTTTRQPPTTTTHPSTTTTQSPATMKQPSTPAKHTSTTTTQPTTTTKQPPTTTTLPPTTMTQPPTTKQLPTTTIKPLTTTSPPPSTTTHSPTTMTQPPKTTTQPPTTATQSPTTTTQPPTTTTQPPTTTTQPPTTTKQSPKTTKQPPTTKTQPPKATTQPPTTTTQPRKRPTTTAQLDTPLTTAMSPTAVVPTLHNTTIPTGKRIKMSFKLGNKFTSDLNNPSSPAFKKLEKKMLKLLAKVYGVSHLASGITHIRIIGFKKGSIEVITEVVANPGTSILSHDIAHALKDYVKTHKKTATRLGIVASSIKAKVRKTTTVKPATTSITTPMPQTITTRQPTTTPGYATTAAELLMTTRRQPATTTKRPATTTKHAGSGSGSLSRSLSWISSCALISTGWIVLLTMSWFD
ncbi:mucin-2-like isoform X2 [Lineus longissimus]|uniref:mucin-2-like isoform X2 n=1 Tax=Lineus longissimus TaxID=88925 RepID=UPI002B4C45F3